MNQKSLFEKDLKGCLDAILPPEIKEDSSQKDYIVLLANTYYTNQTTEEKLLNYLVELIDDKTFREPLLNKIKELKSKFWAMETKETTQSEPAKIEPAKTEPVNQKQNKKSVGERLQPKPEKKENADDKGKKGKNEKIENEQPKKRVKKDIGDGENKTGQNDAKAGLKKKLESEGKQKCRFFPFCKNEENCEFFHPTEKCTYFPNCKHADSCLYIHEACKYKEKCQKFGCPYAHPFRKSSNPFEDMLKGYMLQQQNPFANKKKPKKIHPKPEAKNDGN